jgi:HSP20 family protein
MSLIKVRRKRFPWMRDAFTNVLDTNFFNDDFFTEEDTFPAMNVKENDDNFEIELAVPGFAKKDIEVSLEEDTLHVCAKKQKEEVEENVEGYTRKEFSYNSFDRKLQLPASVDESTEAKATYKNGVLTLQLQKNGQVKEQVKKRIEIK